MVAMRLIRPLFASHGYDVVVYSDDAIADAVVKTCPPDSQSWFSPHHLASAFEVLRRTASGSSE